MHCLSSKVPLAGPADHILHQSVRIFDAFGGAGVDVFFVISGFIIMKIADRPVSAHQAKTVPIRFLARRIARIYPLYWLTLCVMLALSAWAGGGLADMHALKLSVWMLTTTHIPLQNPAWSLPFELWFYGGATVLLFLAPGSFRNGVAVWAALQAAFLAFHVSTNIGPHWAVLTRPQVLEFFLGCAVAIFAETRSWSARQASLLLLLSVVLFTLGSVICYRALPQGSLSDRERVFYWGIAACGALTALVCLEGSGFATSPAWLQRLGDSSYSIYLWHSPIMGLSFLICLKYNIAVPLLLRAALEFGCTLLLARVSYRFIERPLIDTTHRVTSSARPPGD